MSTNTTPAASASRHTPEWIAWKPDGLEAVSFGEAKQLPVGKVFAGPRAAQVAKRIVDDHNALAGMNPEAVRSCLEKLQYACDYPLAMAQNSGFRQEVHAALAALKGPS